MVTSRRSLANRFAGHMVCSALLAGGAVFAGVPQAAVAQQTLARGVALSDMSALRDTASALTTMRATATNRSGAEIPTLRLRFVLRDAAGQDVGEATAVRERLANGEAWQASAQTSVPFVTFTVMNVDATP